MNVDPDAEVTVTVGGTEALFCAIQAIVGLGDDVIVFDPAYDSYDPAVRLAGGRCVHIPLMPPTFRYDWDRVAATITDRTRLIVINTPHNPACTAATAEDLDKLAEVIRGKNIFVLSDEVYEHVTYDGRKHVTVLAHPELRERSVAVFSFGKTLHATGSACRVQRRADRYHARAAQGSSVQHVQHRASDSAGDRAISR